MKISSLGSFFNRGLGWLTCIIYYILVFTREFYLEMKILLRIFPSASSLLVKSNITFLSLYFAPTRSSVVSFTSISSLLFPIVSLTLVFHLVYPTYSLHKINCFTLLLLLRKKKICYISLFLL